jgi:hypothetical protein
MFRSGSMDETISAEVIYLLSNSEVGLMLEIIFIQLQTVAWIICASQYFYFLLGWL